MGRSQRRDTGSFFLRPLWPRRSASGPRLRPNVLGRPIDAVVANAQDISEAFRLKVLGTTRTKGSWILGVMTLVAG